MYSTKWMRVKLEQWTDKNPPPDEEEEIPEWKNRFQQARNRFWQQEVEDAKAKAHLKAVQDAEATLIRKKVQEGEYQGIEELQEYQQLLRNKNKNGGAMHLYYFVTVNCKPDVQLSELTTKVDKYVQRKFIKKAEWVYEQRGSTELEMGKGMHCHILVTQRGDCHDGQFKQNTRNTFKTLVGNPQTHVDIRAVKPEYVDDKREYMRGQKTGEGKVEKCEIDVIWRQKNNLEKYYIQTNGEEEETEQHEDNSEEEDEVQQEVSEYVSEST